MTPGAATAQQVPAPAPVSLAPGTQLLQPTSADLSLARHPAGTPPPQLLNSFSREGLASQPQDYRYRQWAVGGETEARAPGRVPSSAFMMGRRVRALCLLSTSPFWPLGDHPGLPPGFWAASWPLDHFPLHCFGSGPTPCDSRHFFLSSGNFSLFLPRAPRSQLRVNVTGVGVGAPQQDGRGN